MKNEWSVHLTYYCRRKRGYMLNHIYTVVWNHVRNCYLVVSEIAKRHGKKSSTHNRVAAFLAALSLTCAMANAVDLDSYSPVIGADSSIDYLYHGDKTEGSAIFGAKNQIKFTKDANRFYAGNSDYVFGASNTITDSRGVIIQGAKNTVTNAYNYKNPVKEGAGVAVIGSRNSISNQTFATILGLDNVVMGDQSPTSPATSMFVAGNRNTVQSISNAIVMGDDNVLKKRSNVISMGNKNQIEADNAVAVG